MGTMKEDRLYVETPVLFGRDRSLVGVVCRPAAAASPKPFVLLLNAGIIHSPGPNRMNARLARALAHIGISSLRFDQSGIGDSVVPAGATAMHIQERVRIDIDDAMAFAAEICEATTFIVGGLCSGADNALRTAARREDVVGIMLLDLNVARTRGYYLRHYGRRLLRRETWANVLTGRHPATRRLRDLFRGATGAAEGEPDPSLPHDAVVPQDEMRLALQRIVTRDVAILAVFTAGVETQYNYARQFLDLFPEVNFADRLRLQYFKDADHTFTGSALQERLRRCVVGWVSETAFRDADARSGPAEPVRAPRYSLTPRSRLRRRGMQPASGSSEIGTGR